MNRRWRRRCARRGWCSRAGFRGHVSGTLSPTDYPIYTRRIWSGKSRKDRPTIDDAGSVLDPSVVRAVVGQRYEAALQSRSVEAVRAGAVIPPPPKPAKKGKKARQAEAAESAELKTPLVDAQMKENRRSNREANRWLEPFLHIPACDQVGAAQVPSLAISPTLVVCG